MPTAPTISHGLDSNQGYVELDYYNTGSGDHNQIWRMTPSEYGGQFIKIADPVIWHTLSPPDFIEAQFLDFGAANNKSYSYNIVAVASDGSTATSDTVQTSIRLRSAWIHAAHKNNQIGLVALNADGIDLPAITAMSLNDLAPLQNVRSVNTVTRLPAFSSVPRVSMGTIERNVTTVPIWMPLNDTSRDTLRAIYESIYYVCLRTTVPSLGKLFGTITAPREVYSGVTAGIACEFTTCQFSESVA